MKLSNISILKLYSYSILLSYLISYTYSNMLGVDLGSDFFKASILRPGRSFEMVENLQSQTKTASGIAFKGEERIFGPDLFITKVRFPKQAINFMDKFLGETLSSPLSNYDSQGNKIGNGKNEKLEKYINDHFISYDLSENPERKSIDFNVKFKEENTVFSIEELYGMLFRYLKFITEKYTNTRIYDVYVSVPSSWGYKKRHALKQAISLADLSVKGIVTQNTAAATHFISDKNFETPVNYIFYNMGSTYTQASLVSFVNKNTTDSYNKSVEYKEANIIAETWDNHLGGRDFDFKLVRLLMDKHYGTDESVKEKKNYKVAEKMLPSSIKYKEILSANKQVSANILGIESGVNLATTVTKEEYEEYCKDLVEKAYNPIEKLLKMANLTVEDIEQVEILGGGVRVPKVQEVLKEKLGNKIGAHMNGDDSFAFGTAYMFANTTKHFRVKKRVVINNGAPYELKIKISPLLANSNSNKEEAESKVELNKEGHNNEITEALINTSTELCSEEFNDKLAENCVRDINKNTTLYKIRHGYEVSRTVSFKHDSDILIVVNQRMEGEEEEIEVLRYEVTGFKDAVNELKSNNQTAVPKVNLRFKLNESGLLSLNADILYDSILYFNRIEVPKKEETQNKEESSEKANKIQFEYKYTPQFIEKLSEEELATELEQFKAQGRNETDKEYIKVKNIGKSKKQENKITLKVLKKILNYPLPMNNKQLNASKKRLDDIDKFEEDRLRNIEAKNTLETDIYAKKEWIDSEKAKLYTKPEDLEAIDNKIKEVHQWYEDDGWNADTETLLNKHSEFKNLIIPVEKRREKHEKRIKASDELEDEMHKLKEENIKKLIEKKPWISTHYEEVFINEYNRINEWIEEKKIENAKSSLHEDPLVSGETYELKLRQIKREFNKMSTLPKPKEEKKEELIENSEENNTNTEKNNENKEEENKNSSSDEGENKSNSENNNNEENVIIEKNEENKESNKNKEGDL